MADSPFIFEGNAQNFAAVLQNSYQVPVLVDFWASWCQPCQALMPLLEKLATEYQGGFILVKVDADENQELVAQLGVRSLPTVKMFKDGEAVDEFMGALPESEIRNFINKHRSRPTEPYRQQALALQQEGQLTEAIALMQQVLQHEPDFYEAALELAMMHFENKDIEATEKALADIPENEVAGDKLQQLQADIKLAQLKAEASGEDTSELEQRIQTNPDDLQALLDLAKIRIAQGNPEEGLALYLTVIKKDNTFGDGAGQQGLLSAFEILGNGNPLVKSYRGKLFSLLY